MPVLAPCWIPGAVWARSCCFTTAMKNSSSKSLGSWHSCPALAVPRQTAVGHTDALPQESAGSQHSWAAAQGCPEAAAIWIKVPHPSSNCATCRGCREALVHHWGVPTWLLDASGLESLCSHPHMITSSSV